MVGQFTVCGSAFVGGVEIFNPNAMGPWLSNGGVVLAFAGDAVGGFIGGAFWGFLIGLIAAAIRRMVVKAKNLPPPSLRPRTIANHPATPLFFVGLLLGVAIFASSPIPRERIRSGQACSTANTEATSAGNFAHQQLFQDAVNASQRAIDAANDCEDGFKTLYLGTAYFLKAGALDRMQQDYSKPAAAAESNLRDCAQNSFGDAKATCTKLLVGAERYVTQHYCDDSFSLANKADGEIEKNPALALNYGRSAVEAASHCKNAYAYAYRGMALAETAAAQWLTGDHTSLGEFRESQVLMNRCLSELTGASHDQPLLANCKIELDGDNQWLAKIGP